MATSPADSFLEHYLTRHTTAQHGMGLPAWLSWLMAVIIVASTLVCLRVGQQNVLLPTWGIALALAATGVFAWPGLVVSALLSCAGYVLLYLFDPNFNTLSIELLIIGFFAAGTGLMLGYVNRLQARLIQEQQGAGLLRQLCDVWAQSEGSCLKEVDLQGRLQAMNARGLLVMEVCDFDTLRGADWLGFWQGEWQAPARHAFEQALAGHFSRFSGFCPTVAGTPKWWDVLLLPVLSGGGRVESILSLSWDVTELRTHAEALRTANADYKALLDALDDGFYRLDRNWCFVQANARAEALLGQGQSLVGTKLEHLFPDLAAAEFGEALRDAMEYGFPRHFDWHSERFGGWFRVSVYPRPDGVDVFFSDTTASVTAIQHLQTTKARLQLAQTTGRLADWTYDLDQQCLQLSDQALQLIGIEAGTTSHETQVLACLLTEDRMAFVTALLDATEGAGSMDLTVRLARSNGPDHRYFRFVGKAIRPQANGAQLLVGSVQDITEQQIRERSLLEAEAFTRGIIDSLPQCVAVLDDRGRVITGNRAWASATPAASGAPFGLAEGADYLAFCRALAAEGSEVAQSLLEGIEALLEGIGGSVRLEYTLAIGGITHNFQAFALLMGTRQPHVVVAHEDVTEAVQLKAALAAQTQLLKLVHEGSNDGIWEWRPSDNHLYVSERFIELTGYSLEGYGHFVDWMVAHVHPDEAETLAAAWAAHLEHESALDVEMRLRTPRGWSWFRMRGKAEWVDGVLLRVAGALMDINLQRELLARVQASETRFREMVEHLPHVFWEYDVASARLTYLSPALEKVLGMLPELVYRDQDAWLSLVHPTDLAIATSFKQKALIEHQAATAEFRAHSPSGELVWVRDRAFPITNEAGEVLRMIGIAENITEARMFEEKLFETAHFDRATGLPNYDMFLKRLQQQCLHATADGAAFMVLTVAVDRIEWVQQVLGPSERDELVRRLAACFVKALRGRGYLARPGSGHFGILLSRSDEVAQADEVIESLLGSLEHPFDLAGEALKLNACIGIASFPEHGDSAELLLRNAEAAAYAVAQSGLESYAYFDPGQLEHSLNTLRLEAGLERALERAEFELFYQPKVSLSDNRVCGAEALIRWRHPAHGLVSPLHFVPLLEETGLIVRVGLWCIDQALSQLARWQALGLERFVMAVNVSLRQLQPELVDHVCQALALHRVAPPCLELELTESIMHADEGAVGVVNQLKALGVRIAVDDFGTGYATLGSLRSFVPDVVKIDKSFLNHMVSEPADQAIVRSVIEMSHALGMTVVAEGVECEEQRTILEGLHCDQIQGFLASPPINSEEFTDRFVR